MTPGVYRLTRDLPALRPDKRMRHDWRALPMRAGMLFYVVEAAYEGRHAWVEISAGSWSHQYVRADLEPCADLVASLEPIGEMPSTWLRLESRGEGTAAPILDQLVASGVVTLAQVKKAYEEMP